MNHLTVDGGNAMTIYEQIIRENEELKSKIANIDKKLEKAPAGSLQVSLRKYKNGYSIICYLHKNGTCKYLNKKHRKTAMLYAYKRYLISLRKQFVALVNANEAYLRVYDNSKCNLDPLLDNPAFLDLAIPSRSANPDLSAWEKEPYERLKAYPEQIIHPSKSGRMLRSKSEASIDSTLFEHGLFVRTEPALVLPDKTVYPDFEIRSAANPDQIMYWEHFGMMDNMDYKLDACEKLSRYVRHGYIPMVNLIVTFETSRSPLDIRLVEYLVTHFFG